jgi:hypothetical protein
LVVLAGVYAGNPEEKWYRGSVVLNNQQVLVGDISIFPTHHVIMLRTEKGITVLPAGKIESFFFHDDAANMNRKFISRTDSGPAFSQHQLYEVVLSGTIPVLRKQVIMSRGTDHKHDFDYFLLYENEMIELRKFKRLVYPQIKEQSKELLTFVKKGKLDPAQPGNAIKIIRHYNTYHIQETLAMN